MLDSELVDQVKKLLGVDSILIVTAKNQAGGHMVNGGVGIHGEHAQGITHAMALLMADMIKGNIKVTDSKHSMEIQERPVEKTRSVGQA